MFGKRGGRRGQNHSGDTNFPNRKRENNRGNNRQRGNFSGEYKGKRGERNYSGGADGYNQHSDWTRNQNNNENGHCHWNEYQRGENDPDNDDQVSGFKKFRDSNMSNIFGNRSTFGSLNEHHTWYKDNGVGLPTQEEPQNATQTVMPEPPKINTQASELVAKEPPAEPSPIRLKEPIESKEPKLLHKIKAEKLDSDCLTAKQKKAKIETPSSDKAKSSEKENPPTTAVKKKTKEKPNPVKTIKIKKEPVTLSSEKKKAPKEAPPVEAPPSSSTESSSSESSSSDSSSSESSSSDSSEEEDEVPKMPQPMKSTESVKPKKEKIVEDDVVCLGKQINIENLVDDDEKSQSNPCVVCNKQDHSPCECQMKCKKCSQSGYQIQAVCKSCGETYSQTTQSMPKPPNPFVMFMQFMQFCMSQYSDVSSDIKYPFPQFESPSAPVLGPTPTVEVTRKDIAKSKSDRKRTKSGSKHSRKKARMSMNSDNDSDSDNSSKATTSTKRRKKLSKSAAREVEPPQTTQQSKPQHQLPQLGGYFPAHLPFAGGVFGAPNNPMLAFSQMMGFNPSTMNFSR